MRNGYVSGETLMFISLIIGAAIFASISVYSTQSANAEYAKAGLQECEINGRPFWQKECSK